MSCCILELRARVEALEHRFDTQRLATLEWGKDVDMVKRWSDQHLRRIMALEADGPAVPNDREPVSVAAQSTPAGSLVKRIAWMIAKNVSEAIPGTDCTPFARDVLYEVAAWADQQGIQRTARKLREEAER